MSSYASHPPFSGALGIDGCDRTDNNADSRLLNRRTGRPFVCASRSRRSIDTPTDCTELPAEPGSFRVIIALLAAGRSSIGAFAAAGRDVGGTHDHNVPGEAMIRRLAVAAASGPDGGQETNRP